MKYIYLFSPFNLDETCEKLFFFKYIQIFHLFIGYFFLSLYEIASFIMKICTEEIPCGILICSELRLRAETINDNLLKKI